MELSDSEIRDQVARLYENSFLAFEAGDVDEAIRSSAQVIAQARAGNDPCHLSLTLKTGSDLHKQMGMRKEALAMLREAATLSEDCSAAIHIPQVLEYASDLWISGEQEKAESIAENVLNESLGISAGRDDPAFSLWLQHLAIGLSAAQRDNDAIVVMERAVSFATIQHVDDWASHIAVQALLLAKSGRHGLNSWETLPSEVQQGVLSQLHRLLVDGLFEPIVVATSLRDLASKLSSDIDQLVECLGLIHDIEIQEGNAASLSIAEQLVEVASEHSNPRVGVLAGRRLARSHLLAGNFDTGIQQFRDCAFQSQQLHNYELAVQMLIEASNVALDTFGDPVNARSLLDDALTVGSASNDPEIRGIVLCEIAGLLLLTNEPHQAADVMKVARELLDPSHPSLQRVARLLVAIRNSSE